MPLYETLPSLDEQSNDISFSIILKFPESSYFSLNQFPDGKKLPKEKLFAAWVTEITLLFLLKNLKTWTYESFLLFFNVNK